MAPGNSSLSGVAADSDSSSVAAASIRAKLVLEPVDPLVCRGTFS